MLKNNRQLKKKNYAKKYECVYRPNKAVGNISGGGKWGGSNDKKIPGVDPNVVPQKYAFSDLGV